MHGVERDEWSAWVVVGGESDVGARGDLVGRY